MSGQQDTVNMLGTAAVVAMAFVSPLGAITAVGLAVAVWAVRRSR